MTAYVSSPAGQKNSEIFFAPLHRWSRQWCQTSSWSPRACASSSGTTTSPNVCCQCSSSLQVQVSQYRLSRAGLVVGIGSSPSHLNQLHRFMRSLTDHFSGSLPFAWMVSTFSLSCNNFLHFFLSLAANSSSHFLLCSLTTSEHANTWFCTS